MGGGLALSAILALSLTFASCANNSDSDGSENPSPTLPSNVGENPIKKTIKLNRDGSNHRYLELRTDGTALDIYVDDDDKSKETEAVFKYTYDDEKKTITMKLEKYYYEGFFEEEEVQLQTYDELCSKIDKEITVEKIKQFEKEYYKEHKDDEQFKKYYPNCNSYDDYEAALVQENGFTSFAALVEYQKQTQKNLYKAYFGTQITYAYEIENDKMTLTEKFTGIKNLFNSNCKFSDNSSSVYISCYGASVEENDDYYYGPIDTDKKTISFESEDGKKTSATYTEDTSAGTVTIKFKDKEYVCQFEGEKYTQVE